MALRDGLPVYDGIEEGWEKTFVTENRAYYKDSRMREMDTRLGDIYGHICGEHNFSISRHGKVN